MKTYKIKYMKPIETNREQFFYKVIEGEFNTYTQFYKRKRITWSFFLLDLINWLFDIDLRYTYKYEKVFFVNHIDIEDPEYSKEEIKRYINQEYEQYVKKKERIRELQNGEII